jgi:general secretion pathway protein C
MRSNVYGVWRVRGTTFLLFALAAGSAVYWALQGWGAGTVAGAPLAAAAGQAPLDPRAVARALGGGVVQATAEPAPAAVASRRFVLRGVIADLSSGGAALISVDGKPPKPFPVGASVDGRLVLKLVQGRRALLAPSMDAPAEVTLELPPLAK